MSTRVVPTLLFLLAVLAVGQFQKKCCIPSQFVMNSGGLVKTGTDAPQNFYGQSAFDLPNKRQGQILFVKVAGQITTTRIIQDFSKQAEYFIDENLKTCQKMPLGNDYQHCVPDNAVYAGQIYLGDHKLNANVWTYFVSDKAVAANVTATYSVDECIPLSFILETVVQDVSMLQVFGLTNYTKGIDDPAKFFSIPKYCSQDLDHRIPEPSVVPTFNIF